MIFTEVLQVIIGLKGYRMDNKTKEQAVKILQDIIKFHENEIKEYEKVISNAREDLTKLEFKKDNKCTTK